jgi:hypothetical protein
VHGQVWPRGDQFRDIRLGRFSDGGGQGGHIANLEQVHCDRKHPLPSPRQRRESGYPVEKLSASDTPAAR